MEQNKVTVPITVIVLVARKEGVSLDYFKDYYSNHHLPYFYKLTNAQELISSHTLHFVQTDKSGKPTVVAGLSAGDWKYDAVTRVVFKDHEAYEEMQVRHQKHLTEISEDEEKFLDQSTMKAIVMEENVGFEFP